MSKKYDPYEFRTVTIDDFETWGGPGQVICFPHTTEARHKDDYDNGELDSTVKDRETTVLWVDGLLDIYLFLRKSRVLNPKLRKLLDAAVHFQGDPRPVGEARPVKS